jgi:predicted dehydrogenase
VNVLLVGLGRWGAKHLRVLTELGATVWVADVSPAALEWAVAQGVDPARAGTDYRTALPRVDAVDIVTPADSHHAIAIACVTSGWHCFVEKPLAATAAEARDLVAKAATARSVLQVGHIFRFHPVTAVLRAALDAGRLGSVRYATGRFSGFRRPRTDVGVTQTDALHYFDLFAYLFDRPATGVLAIQRDYLGRGLDDMSVTTVDYGDIPVIVEANYFVPGTHRECVIVGTRGALVADYGASTVTFHAGEHRRQGAAWDAVDLDREEIPARGDEPLRLEMQAFLEACAGRRSTAVPAAAGLAAIAIADAAARSSEIGARVALP